VAKSTFFIEAVVSNFAFLMKEQICFCNENTCLPDRRIKCTSKLFDKKKKLLTKTFLSDNSFFRLLLDAAKIMISVKLNWFFRGINMRSSQSVSSFLRSFVFWLLCATQVLIRWASHHFVSWKKKEKHTDSPALCWSQQTHRQRRNTQTVLLYVEVDRLTDREETHRQSCCLLK
jgi:hypothetical protein